MKIVGIIIAIVAIVYLLRRGLVANASLQAAQNPPGWGSGLLWGPGGPMPKYPYGYNAPWYDNLGFSFQNGNEAFSFGG